MRVSAFVDVCVGPCVVYLVCLCVSVCAFVSSVRAYLVCLLCVGVRVCECLFVSLSVLLF